MRPGAVGQRRSPPDQGGRRLVGALLVSLLVHGLILSLQFGIPALGLPGSATPIEVRLANVADQPTPAPPLDTPAALPPLPLPSPLPEPDKPAASSGGMRLIDPVPAPAPVPTPVTPRLAVKKDKPRKAKRISPPLPATDALAMDSRVMVQDSVVNDFAVPMPRPEEAEQKTIDLKEAQHGTDDGNEATSAAEVAEAARTAQLAETRRAEEEAARLAAQRKLETEEEARKLAELQARQQQEKAAAAESAQQQEQQARVAQQAQVEADAARERASVLRAEQQKTAQLALQQKAKQQKAEQQKAEQQKAEQLRADQQKADQQKADQQKAEQLRADQQKADQQKADQQKAEQMRAEQAKAERQRAEQLAAQQQAAQKAAEQQAAQKLAEQAAQNKADQAAQASEAARQAALQGGREGSGTQAANIPPGGTAAGAGSGAGGKAVIPKNLLGSELSNRAREMVKGLDILSGTPPPPMRDERRVAVGAAERDLPLRMYVESWRQKIERNGGVNYPRGWADAEYTHALVNVAVRSDGTVQDVTILRSSGRADMDEAVLRIVRVNARYAPFPPNIAARYDVIDIRRVWQFGDNLKLMEEVR
ncbi:TonB family protein [Massilia genomosp. 1]|uniref:TonB family protein n=1 Tax=Massilia genomosp. 1 TaxID=2609280 RepID=A0ABX0N2C8_9BURK|nr:TonB family protein [Massilia genomosp. 1]NHZ66528.1 TonB family protein [Massilia genomosp. 1]